MPKPKIEHLRLEDFFTSEAIPSVRRYLGSTIKGNSIDYRTPLYKEGDQYPDRISLIKRMIRTIFDDRFQQKYPGLYEYEMEMLEKAGPMSIRKPWVDRIQDLEHYYTDIDLPTVDFTAEDRTNVANFYHARRNIRSRDLANTIDNMKLNTNSGTCYFTTRSLVAGDTLNWLWNYTFYNEPEMANLVVMTIGNKANAAIAGWRGQEGGGDPDDVKQRIILMFPFSINALELCVYQPLIQYVQALDLLPAYISKDRVDEEVTALFDSKPADDYVICTDFTRFDQHFNKTMQDFARDIIGLMLANNEANDGWMRYVYNVKYNIPVITPFGVGTGPHGMGSGSGGTNFDESISHKGMQFHAASDAGQELNPHSMTHGDDGILTFPGITPDFIEREYKLFGQDVNQNKFHVSKETAVFLRCIYHKDYRPDGKMRGVYSLVRALNHMLTQERYFDPKKGNAEMVDLRWLSIIENCKGHPAFHQFIEFVLKGDKYKLGLSIPGFYTGLYKWVQYANKNFKGLFSYNQELRNDATGIYNGAVVRYLLHGRLPSGGSED